jgi:hypothetical protein
METIYSENVNLILNLTVQMWYDLLLKKKMYFKELAIKRMEKQF